MTRPYSNDLRERVVRAHLAGEPIRSVAARFGVGVSCVPRWTARYRRTGSVAPGGQGRRPSSVAAGVAPGAGSRADPQDAASDHRPASGPSGGRRHCGVPGHDLAVSEARGSELQKTLFALKQARRTVSRKRPRWRALNRRLDPDRLVFVDETWIKTNMAPLRGWAEKGRRLKGHAPHSHWRTMTFLAGLRTDGLCAPYVFDGPINGRCFRAWVEQLLVPTLRPGAQKGPMVHDSPLSSSRAGQRLWIESAQRFPAKVKRLIPRSRTIRPPT